MPFEPSKDIHPDLAPIAWMIGRWEGNGKAAYPGIEGFDFGQQIDFAHNGGNYLHYLSQMFEVDDDGMAIRPLDMETGFWRPQSDGSLEVVMCNPAGYAEVWYGSITGSKIELATDAVVRTASAEDYAAGSGSTATSLGTFCGPSIRRRRGTVLQTYMWGRLRRV